MIISKKFYGFIEDPTADNLEDLYNKSTLKYSCQFKDSERDPKLFFRDFTFISNKNKKLFNSDSLYVALYIDKFSREYWILVTVNNPNEYSSCLMFLLPANNDIVKII